MYWILIKTKSGSPLIDLPDLAECLILKTQIAWLCMFFGNTYHCTITFTVRSRAVAAYFVKSNELKVVSSVRMSSMGCQGHKLLSTLSYLIVFT